MGPEHQLLDVTDRTRRPLQHGAVFAGVAVLLFAGSLANRPDALTLALVMIAGGLALFVAAAVIKQKWAVTHEGHDVRFENNPFLGEKLFINGRLAGKGKLGIRSEIRGVIPAGDGAGDTVIVRTEAGLFTFRCRITVHAVDAANGVAVGVSDEQLLAEVRRRGLVDPT